MLMKSKYTCMHMKQIRIKTVQQGICKVVLAETGSASLCY